MRYFCKDGHLNKIAESVGGVVVKHTNDFKAASEALKLVEYGKEYYFGCSEHAAIIKKVKDEGFYFLELQDLNKNGWEKLTTQVLKERFDATHTQYTVEK
ncbi:MAG: hypothetical protein KBT13_11615 [Bacteroidales bacterium]|nr:hypothetical protein [Candidatus Sodaliphilus limicaballi]